MKRKRVVRNIMSDEGEDHSNDYHREEIESSESISQYNDNVHLILDEKKKGICTDTVKPLSNFSLNSMNQKIGEPSCGYCVICEDAKPCTSTVVPCEHRYCVDCFQLYVAVKIQENASMVIDCVEKDCKIKLSSSFWSRYVPEEVFRRKRMAYLESRCLASTETITCPCCLTDSLDDNGYSLIKSCTNCCSVICTRCMVRWHSGMSCREFRDQQFHEKTI